MTRSCSCLPGNGRGGYPRSLEHKWSWLTDKERRDVAKATGCKPTPMMRCLGCGVTQRAGIHYLDKGSTTWVVRKAGPCPQPATVPLRIFDRQPGRYR